MSLDPKVSFQTIDAVFDSTFKKTLVIVGQSNDATAGIYKDVELYSEKMINTAFGADSHLAALLRDARNCMTNSLVKPRIWAISYEDKADAVARILETVVSGTSTEDKTLKIRINSSNPDRLSTQAATILALRNTKGSNCGEFARNTVEKGAPSNANLPFYPVLSSAFANDVIIEVEITKGMDADATAAAIDVAINASTASIYGSDVTDDTLTITSKHKGALSNFFNFEILPSSIPAGLSFATTQDTAGSGVVVSTGILDIADEDGMKLSELNFDYISLPFGYSVTALVNDASAKVKNALEYNNQCLNYHIFRANAIDLSNFTALNSLASAEPVEEKGIVKTLFIMSKGTINVSAVNDYTIRNAIKAKQFTPIQKELNGSITIGQTSTLSDSVGFVDIERHLTAMFAREIIVEKFIPDKQIGFQERNFATGKSVSSYSYTRDQVISKFKFYRDILDGTNINTVYANDYAGVISNSDLARATYEEILDASVSYDKSSKVVALKLANELLNKIGALDIIASYS